MSTAIRFASLRCWPLHGQRGARASPRVEGGFSLVEVLVTLVLLAIGLVGLASLQARTTVISIEASQRTQAMLLAYDMAARIAANKPQAASYVGDGFGAGSPAACPTEPGSAQDLCAWSNALRGASEKIGTQAVGTLHRGRGCVTAPEPNLLVVVVAWQGMLPTAAPAADCGRGDYGNESLRRAIVMPVHLARLGA